jgi:hypothetical protein
MLHAQILLLLCKEFIMAWLVQGLVFNLLLSWLWTKQFACHVFGVLEPKVGNRTPSSNVRSSLHLRANFKIFWVQKKIIFIKNIPWFLYEQCISLLDQHLWHSIYFSNTNKEIITIFIPRSTWRWSTCDINFFLIIILFLILLNFF